MTNKAVIPDLIRQSPAWQKQLPFGLSLSKPAEREEHGGMLSGWPRAATRTFA
jgi:hypothetical protein